MVEEEIADYIQNRNAITSANNDAIMQTENHDLP